MTTASELFYHRRSRIGRHSDSYGAGSDLGSPPPPVSINRRHRRGSGAGGNHSRRDRLDPESCNPLRRPLHQPRQASQHRSSHPPQERESVRLEEGNHQFSPRDRLRLSGNDNLPGAVLLARERLLQRLRGVTLSGSRRSNRNSSTSQHSDVASGDDFRLADTGDWETEIAREWLASIAPIINPATQDLNNRSPALTEEALSCLAIEIFSAEEESDESRVSRECSICLESFLVGDELIRLPCNHMYHLCCLDPWVRTCGDCPYCRRSIDSSSERILNKSES